MLDLLSDDWNLLSDDQQIAWAREAMNTLIASAEDSSNHISIAGFLTALQVKGAKGTHLAGFASALRRLGRSIDFNSDSLVDTCGTGGGSPSFNISTGAALLAAAAGAKVAKHGNKAVTSRSGSADVLNALGIGITPDEEKLQTSMKEAGFAFLFAPFFYEPLKNLAPIRMSLGIRTVFNQLGPLLNPANADKQIIGVYDPALLQPTAQALHLLGANESLVVHGSDGLDEITPTGDTSVWRAGSSKPETWQTTLFISAPLNHEDIAPGDSAAQSAEMIETALNEVDSVPFLAVLPSAATAVSLSLNLTLEESTALCREAAASGSGSRVLSILREVVPA